MLEAYADLDTRLMPQHYGHLWRSPINGEKQVPLSDDQQAEVVRRLGTEVLPTMLRRIDRVLRSTEGPWVCGSRLSVADVVSAVIVWGLEGGTYVGGIQPSVLDGCEALREHAKRVRALPAVQRWQASDRA